MVGQRLETADKFAVHFVSLRETPLSGLVLFAIAGVLSCEGREDGANQIQEILKAPTVPTLLVLDPFEHVTEAYPDLWELLNRFSQLKILVVSRSASYVSNRGGCSRSLISRKHLYVVPPLSYPDRAAWETVPERLLEYEAVALFVERAQAFQPDLVITPEDSRMIAEMCYELGGVLSTSPRDAQRAVRSNEVALGRLSCCCAFCEEGVVTPYRQQASAVTKMVPEAAVYYTVYLL